jgi:hypothetical protein
MEKTINNIIPAHLLAAYSCNAYGANAYSSTCSATTTSPSGGLLANTGYPILSPLALGAALIIAALILLVKQWRRRRHTAVSPNTKS